MTKDNASGAGIHSRIMNIQLRRTEKGDPMGYSVPYREGHRDARHAAAEIALDAERLLAESQAHNAKLEAQVERLRTVNAALLDQMHHFANADQQLWDESQRDPESFKSWVRSRAAHMLAKFNTKDSQ